LDLAGVGEAKLECTVTNPLKENDGSKDAYMSYLVTTTVGTLSSCQNPTDLCRPTSPASLNQSPQSADVSPTSYSSTRHSAKNLQHAPSHPYQTSIRWNTSAATDSGQTSHNDEPTPYTDSSHD
jgi:hypothetical protein